MWAPSPVPVLAVNGIGVIGVDTALLLRGHRVGMEDAPCIWLTNPTLLIGSSGEGDDVRLQELPLFIDFDEFVVVFADEPIGRWNMLIAGIWRNGHGMRA